MKPYGIAATFKSAPAIYEAAERVRDAGYRRWDCYTPFPVHGLNHAMGLRRPHVPKLTFLGGLTGFCTGMLLAWFTGSFDYALIVGGKPFFHPVFPFPVAYELTILFGAFGTLIGMFLFNLLPRHNHPVFNHPQWERFSQDAFLIVIESRDPFFNAEETRELLREIGGEAIQDIYEDED